MLKGTATPRTHNPILDTLRWQVTLFRKVFAVAPGKALLAIGVSIIARIIRLLSVVLPLKSIMVAGSSEVPEFILYVFPNAEKNAVVIALCVLTVVFYLMHILLGRFFDAVIEHGALDIARKADKISAKIDIEAETVKQYRYVVRSVSAAVFIAILLGVLSTFYPKLSLSVLVYGAVALVVLTLLNTSERIRAWLGEHRVPVQERTLYAATLMIFVVIILDVLSGDVTDILIAVIGLILARQAITATGEYARIAAALREERDHVETVFFHRPVVVAPPVAKRGEELWSALNAEKAHEAVREAVAATAGTAVDVAEVRWIDTGVYDIASFDAALATGGRRYTKIFNSNRVLLCAHEELLLRSEGARSLPALPLLGRADVGGSPILVHEAPASYAVDIPTFVRTLPDMLVRMWGVRLPQSLSGPFRRTNPPGVSAITDATIERLLVAATTPEDRAGLIALRGRLSKIVGSVLAMPTALTNPEITTLTAAVDADSRLVATHWGRWGIEPVGTSLWEFAFLTEADAASMAQKLKRGRSDCRAIGHHQLMLAAQLYAFWKQFQRQKFRAALDAVPGILQNYAAIEGNKAA